MNIEICTVGGYSEVGKNMTAIKIGEEVIICDMGFFLPAIVELGEEETVRLLSSDELIKIGAIPNDYAIRDWWKKTKGIFLGHCHLDHIAAVPFLAAKYRAPIYGTPYTISVLKTILDDEKVKLPNKIMAVKPNSKVKVSENITVEFVNITHSTLQCSVLAIHANKKLIMYCCDFKLDNKPVLGEKPDYKKLNQLARKGVSLMFLESLYAPDPRKTPSEGVARELLKDVLLGVENKNKAIFITCFASHIARVKSAVEFAHKLNRKVVILGRSMKKYVGSAITLGLVKFNKNVDIVNFTPDVKAVLAKVMKNKGKYVVICTGSQGEPGSILNRIINGKLKFRLEPEDNVIFSCKTIPAEINIKNRARMEESLRQMKVRFFTDIHVSGHAGREDLRDFINILKPEIIIPCHGEKEMICSLGELSEEMGYKKGKNYFLMKDCEFRKL